MDQSQIAQFTALWTQAQPAVFAFISSTVISFDDAEDVLQKVASVAVTKFDEFDSARPFTGWAIGIAQYEILMYLRTHANDRHEFVAEALGHIAVAFENVAPDLDEQRGALAACLKRLTCRSREVVEKRYAEGLKTAAIARLMGLTPGNVSVILNRSYQKLRECIDTRLAADGVAS